MERCVRGKGTGRGEHAGGPAAGAQYGGRATGGVLALELGLQRS